MPSPLDLLEASTDQELGQGGGGSPLDLLEAQTNAELSRNPGPLATDTATAGPDRGFLGATADAFRAIPAGANAGRDDLVAAVARLFGDATTAKRVDAQTDRNLELTGADRGLPRFVAGAGRSLVPMVAGAPLGPVGALVPGVGISLSQASGSADEAGLTGVDKLRHVFTQGALEAVPELVAQRLGLGGAEQVLADAFRRGGESGLKLAVKELIKAQPQEVGTELVTSFGQAAEDKRAGVDQTEWSAEQAANIAVDTTLQTLLLTGAAGAPRVAMAALADRAKAQEAPAQSQDYNRKRLAELGGEPGTLTPAQPSEPQPIQADPRALDQPLVADQPQADPLAMVRDLLQGLTNAQDSATPGPSPADAGPAQSSPAPVAPPVAAGAQAAPGQPATVQMIVTSRMRRDLTDLGYKREQIDAMKPDEAAAAIRESRGPEPVESSAAAPAPTGQPAASPSTEKGIPNGQEDQGQAEAEALLNPSAAAPGVQTVTGPAPAPASQPGAAQPAADPTGSRPEVASTGSPTPSPSANVVANGYPVGTRVRFTKGAKKGTEATVASVTADGRPMLKTDDGKALGGKFGITPDNLEVVNVDVQPAQAPAPVSSAPASQPPVDVPPGRVQRATQSQPVGRDPGEPAQGQATQSAPAPAMPVAQEDGAKSVGEPSHPDYMPDGKSPIKGNRWRIVDGQGRIVGVADGSNYGQALANAQAGLIINPTRHHIQKDATNGNRPGNPDAQVAPPQGAAGQPERAGQAASPVAAGGDGADQAPQRSATVATAGGSTARAVSQAVGDSTDIEIPGSKPVSGRYEVRELAEIKASHTYQDGSPVPTEGFPAGLQPRDYRLGNDEDLKVKRQVGAFKPAYLISDHPDATSGPSVITNDGVVINGNSRVMTLQNLSPQQMAEYRTMLGKKASGFGIDPSQVRGMRQPVLVRVVDMAPDSQEAQRFARQGNVSATQAQSPVRTAASLGGLVNQETIDALDLGDDTTFSEAVTGPSGRAFRRQVLDALPPTVRGTYFDEATAELTDPGKTLMRDLLLTKVMPPELIERTGEDRAGLMRSVEGAVPQLLRMQGMTAGEPVRAALVESLGWLAAHPTVKREADVAGLIDSTGKQIQQDLFGDQGEALSPEGRMLLSYLLKEGGAPRRFKGGLVGAIGGLDNKVNSFLADTLGEPAQIVAEALGVPVADGATFAKQATAPVVERQADSNTVVDGETPSQQTQVKSARAPRANAPDSIITDVGEKIGGARKDRLRVDDLAGLTDEQRQEVGRSSIWSEPDWSALIDGGMPAETAHLVQQAYRGISTVPGIDPKDRADQAKRDEAIRTYVETITKLREGLMAARSVDDVRKVLKSEWPGIYLPGMGGYHGEGAAMRERDIARYRTVGRSNALANSFSSKAIGKAKKDVADGWPSKEPWHTRYRVGQSVYAERRGRWVVQARNEALRRAERMQDGGAIGPDFATREEAEAEAARRYAGLTREQKSAEPQRPLNPDAKREGPDRRTEGQDVTADAFRSEFGFKGVEFGNWTNQADRQQAINQAYDGLYDLAELMGIPPAALSLDGKLGLAFGARGKGKAAAHYEPGRVVINLTRTNGAGSLAHEWGHAVDNYFGKMGSSGDLQSYSSAEDAKLVDEAGKAGIRPEIVEGWRKIRQAMQRGPDGKPSNYLKESRAADKDRTPRYWSTPHEMFARAFETWAAQRMEENGTFSPYLVQGVPTLDATIETANEWTRRYPVGEDAQRIGAAIDAWTKELKTEVTPEGSTRLYDLADEGGRKLVVDERAANRRMAGFGRIVRGPDGWTFRGKNGVEIDIRQASPEQQAQAPDARGWFERDQASGRPTIYLVPGKTGPFTLDHELVHAAVASGVLSRRELAALVRLGRKKGIDAAVRKLGYRRQVLAEEIAAHVIEAIHSGQIKTMPGFVQRVLDWVRRLGEAFDIGRRSDDQVAREAASGRQWSRSAQEAQDGGRHDSLLAAPGDSLAFDDLLKQWRKANGDRTPVRGSQEWQDLVDQAAEIDAAQGRRFSLSQDQTDDRTPAQRMADNQGAPEGIRKAQDRKEFVVSFRRHFQHLDPAENAEAIRILREFEAQQDAAAGQAAREINRFVEGLSPAQAQHYAKQIELADIVRQIEAGEFIGNDSQGRTPQDILAQVQADLAAAEREGGEAVAAAVAKRRAFQREHTRKLVEAKLLDESALDDDRYFHRQVMAHMANPFAGLIGSDQVRNRTRGFQRERSGGTASDVPFYGENSRRDFNTAYHQAEFEYLSQSMQELAKVDALAKIRQQFDRLPEVKAEAKARNRAAMDEWWQREVEAQGGAIDHPERGWDFPYRATMAMNNANLADLAADSGGRWGGPFAHVWQRLADARNAWRGRNDDVEPADREPWAFNHPEWWPALSWLVTQPELKITATKTNAAGKSTSYQGSPGIHAGAILKAIAEREQFTRKTLSEERAAGRGPGYQTWHDVARELEGFAEWQPEKGLQMGMGYVVEDEAVRAALVKAGIDPEAFAEHAPDVLPVGESEARRGMVVYGKKPVWLIPEEIAAQLDEMESRTPKNPLAKRLEVGMRAWKQWILMNPLSVVRYNLNNAVGDLDVALTNPGALKELARDRFALGRDLWNFTQGNPQDAETQALFEAAEKVGLIDSGVQVAELPDVDRIPGLGALFGKKPEGIGQRASDLVSRYFGTVQRFSRWREGLARVGAARNFYRQISPTNRRYAASRRDEMDQLYDEWGASINLAKRLEENISRRRSSEGSEQEQAKMAEAQARARELKASIAAKLARELLGDYGALSVSGQWLRRSLIPFWSWMEINLPRYARLINNARFENGGGTSQAIGASLAITGGMTIRMAALTAGVYAFNAAMKAAWGIDDDQDPNKDADLSKMQIILGKDGDGKVYGIRVAGALMDALGWFDGDATLRHVKDVAQGMREGKAAAALRDVAEDIGMAPVNRIASSVNPALKETASQATGRDWFPDVRKPRPIGGRLEHLAGSVGLGKAAQAAQDKLPWWKVASGAVIAESDPRTAATYRIRDKVESWASRNGVGLRAMGGEPTERSTALRQARAAFARGETDRAMRLMDDYYDLGGKPANLGASKAGMHPLSALAKADWARFTGSLNTEDRAALARAISQWKEFWDSPDEGFKAMALKSWRGRPQMKPANN